MTDPTVIRASSVPNYPDCPLRWAAEHLRGEVETMGYELRRLPRHVGAANGTAVHKAGAHLLTGKMETGELEDADAAIEIGIESLRSQAGEAEILWDGTTPEMNTAEQQILRQVVVYRNDVAPGLEPVTVEQSYEAEIKPGFVVRGHPDVLVPMDLHDLKTGKTTRNHAGQLGTYALLARSAGEKADRAYIDFIQRVSLKTRQPRPEREEYDVAHAEQHAYRVIQRIVRDVEAFRETGDLQGAFLANPSSFLCSDRYCPAWGTQACSAWRKKD